MYLILSEFCHVFLDIYQRNINVIQIESVPHLLQDQCLIHEFISVLTVTNFEYEDNDSVMHHHGYISQYQKTLQFFHHP